MPLFKGKASKAKPQKGIDYITDPKKADIVSSLAMDDNENYAKQFKQTCDLFGKGSKNNERKYYHFKLSVDPNDNPTLEQSHEFAERLAQELFSAHECVIATHDDTDTLHTHIIVNAVSFETGKKLHLNDSAYRNCKDLADKMGAELGFTPLKWREKTATKRRRTKNDISLVHKDQTNAERNIAKRDFEGIASWKDALRYAIDEAKTVATNRAEFQNYLYENFGVTMPRNTGKTVSFVHPAVGENYTVRGAKLGGLYTTSNIDRALQNNHEKILEAQERSALNARLFIEEAEPDTGADFATVEPFTTGTTPSAAAHTKPNPTAQFTYEPVVPSQSASQIGNGKRTTPRSISDISAELRGIDEAVHRITLGSQQQHDGERRDDTGHGNRDTEQHNSGHGGIAEHNRAERPTPTRAVAEPTKPEPVVQPKPKRRSYEHSR